MGRKSVFNEIRQTGQIGQNWTNVFERFIIGMKLVYLFILAKFINRIVMTADLVELVENGPPRSRVAAR